MREPDHTAPAPTDHLVGVADQIAAGVVERSLPKSRWTHEGHLLACVSLVRRHGATVALATLRAAIPPYNVATGVANRPTGGYHDTITVYYVWAVDVLLARGLTTPEVLVDPLVERTALLRWWDRDTLMSAAARARWAEPNLETEGVRPKEHLQPQLIDA